MRLTTAILTECDHLQTYDRRPLSLQANGRQGFGMGSFFSNG